MIYTSNYFTAWGKDNIVQISNGKPKTLEVSETMKELYPKWTWIRAKYPWEEFSEKYNKLLSELDVHEFAKKCEGKVLCCYENIEKKHCHRELVTKWFIDNGYKCEELPKKKSKAKKKSKNVIDKATEAIQMLLF